MFKFVIHKSVNDDWTEYHVIESNGYGYGRMYYYHNTKSDAIMDSLSVSETFRNKGLGTAIQLQREEIAKSIGATTICLWVDNKSWMKDWYARRGYVYFADKDSNNIWMEKTL